MRTIIAILSLFLVSCHFKQANSKTNFPNGGYEFSKQINSKDSGFPFYPIRSIEKMRDSTYDAFYSAKLLQVFNEPNISLRPEENPVFRIIFSEWTRPIYIIRITEDQIIIKKGLQVDYLHKDEERLSETEQYHLSILERGGAPFSRRLKEADPEDKRRLDSLSILYPDLLRNGYYEFLMKKAFIPLDSPFTYSTKAISISKSQFIDIVDKLKNSNYWNLPLELYCYDIPTDGYQFIMECNSGVKYNIVKFWSCGDIATPFKNACKEIIEFAKLSKDIHL